MNKAELRKKCREIINGTPPEKFSGWGKKIYSLVSETYEWKRAETVFVFVSMEREADTAPLIAAALQNGKRLCVPKITGDGKMEAVEIKNISELKCGKFGILEPAEGCTSVEKSGIDLIVMPCLAADEKGNRLGRGGGYYDRFCEEVSSNKIIICPEMLLMKCGEIPTEEHDVSADIIATERRIITVSPKID